MNKIELVKSANEWGNPNRNSYYTDDFQFTDAVGSPPMDKSAFLAMGQLMESAMPDISTVIEDIREEGDDVVITSHWSGTFTNDFDLSAMSGIGYKQIGLFLKGALPFEAAVQQIKFETHRFVRHQYSWFRLKDERIRWFDIRGERVESEITAQVAGFTSE